MNLPFVTFTVLTLWDMGGGGHFAPLVRCGTRDQYLSAFRAYKRAIEEEQ
jgi:hypothetical protein